MVDHELRPQNFEDRAGAESVYVARQPVFDGEMQVWGYELLFRQSAQSRSADVEDGNVATSRVMVDGFSLAQEWLSPNQKVLINYPGAMLLQGAPLALPAEMAVVEILETVRPDPEILSMCRQLKNEGYTLALDDFVGDPGFEPLLELADLVKVDVLGLDPGQLCGIVSGLAKYPCTLLAEKVEDLAMFDLCREHGFSLFQGYFFSRPQIVSGKKLSSNQISKLKLLQELGTLDLDLGQISKIIQADVSLSYRLLRYINSPGMGLAHAVKSIAQAVNLLGQRKITAWLRVLILADLDPAPQARELLFFSLQRARFLELMAQHKRAMPLSADAMFLLGLFSSLDALLSQPMEEIIGKLGLEPRLAAGLLGKDAELRVWMSLALSTEQGQWEGAEAALVHVGVGPQQSAKILNSATVWAKNFLRIT